MSLHRFRGQPVGVVVASLLALSVGCAPTSLLPGAAGNRHGNDPGMERKRIAQLPPATGNGDTGVAPASDKTLFAVYLLGSDLEDDLSPRNKVADEKESGKRSEVGSGSADLRELIEGYNRLSEAERAHVDVLVAFGGARKEGWQGIKYADLSILAQDARDNYFGNESSYLTADADADMGNEQTFRAFLEQVQARGQGAGKVYVDVWNHGGSYLGIGPDTNTRKSLSLPAMRRALQATSFKADVIGFDACLMASLEVANTVQGHFDYMVASEELEPGHGWDYTPIVEFMGRQPKATAVGLAKQVVDSFIESPRHRETNGRTLSVVNLNKMAGLVSAVDSWADGAAGALAETYQPVLTSAKAAQPYGVGAKGNAIAVDLAHFALGLKAHHPAGAAAAQAVENAVKGAVVYARHGGDKPQSNGISIYALTNLAYFERQLYNQQNAASSGWWGFVQTFLNRGGNDSLAPVLQALGGGLGTQAAGDEEWRVSDDIGVESVDVVHARLVDGNRLMIVAVEPAAPTPGSQDRYTLPQWDGTTLHLVSNGKAVEVPYDYAGETEAGTLIYTADAVWNGEDVVMHVEYDGETGDLVDMWMVPYDEAEADDPHAPREQYVPEAGDTLAFYQPVYGDKDEIDYQLGTAITLGNDFDFEERDVPGTKAYFLLAEDLKGNVKYSEPRLVGGP